MPINVHEADAEGVYRVGPLGRLNMVEHIETPMANEELKVFKAINNGVLPPTLNLDHPSDGCEGFNLVPKTAQERKVKAALSNSFGFGGTNASLIFREFV